MIEGVFIEPLSVFRNEGGKVLHMLKCDSPHFKRFGEIYFSVVNSGAVKAWKKHLKMTQHFAVLVGRIRLVIYDSRKGSTYGETEVVEIGEDNYSLVVIPPLVYYGFKGISSMPAIIANCTDLPHNQNETECLDVCDKAIPYDWSL